MRDLKIALPTILAALLPLAIHAAVPTGSATPPAITIKLAPRIARVAAATAAGQDKIRMQRALLHQLFRKNSPLDVRWNASGMVQVYLHYQPHAAPPEINTLASLGATDVLVSRPLAVVQAWIPAQRIYDVAALPEVTRITLPQYAVVKRAPKTGLIPRDGSGSVDTEGDQILNAADFRTATGYDGTGIAVGIISDGDDSIATSQSSGDLPATIWNAPGLGGSGDEGTAMMEIVHDLAPGASLGFCGPQTTADFITCLTEFANHFGNSKLVIVDDLGWPGVAMFTDGGYASAVEQFAQANPNVHLVTAAGNDAQAFWAGDWNPMPIAATVNGVTYSQAQNFGTATSPNDSVTLTVQPGASLIWILEWGDQWVNSDQVDGSTANDPNDYDIVLFDANGNALACNQGINISDSSQATPACNQANTESVTTPGPQPIQGNNWKNTSATEITVHLKIFFGAGTPDKNLKLLAYSELGTALIPNTSMGSIYGQAALAYPSEIAVGAVSSAKTTDDKYKLENFSSQGPVNLTLLNETRHKPELVGVDGVAVTGAGGFENPFYGTSAAAPHIAGLIALLEQGYPNDDPVKLLEDGAVQLGSGNPNDKFGYGLPDMLSSIRSNYQAPTAIITAPSTGTVGQVVSLKGACNANGAPGGMTYNWDFGAVSGIDDVTVQNPGVTFNLSGTFTITFTCTNIFGGQDQDTKSITINHASTGSDGSGKSGGGGGTLGLLALGVLLMTRVSMTRRK